jgi:hypothetical protein
MATGNEKASFSVVLDDKVSDPADNAADAVEALRSRMSASQSTIKDLNAQLRNLVGKSKDVTAAKEQLRARLNAEKDALSKGQLALVKNAEAVKRLDERTKLLAKQKGEAEERTRRMSAALSSAGGPIAALRAKFASLSEVVGGGGKAALVAGLAGVVAIATAITAAVAGAAVKLGSFVLQAANAARTAGLLREAVAGSALNADALGTQVDALARVLPTGKEQLNELAVSLAKAGIQGQTLVDTFNAIGQAQAAIGDDAAGKLRELVERGRLSQTFTLNPLELQGSGLQFDDVAKALGEQMHVGVDKARAALFEGRVRLADGAAALRKAVEGKFSNLNLRKMLDLNVIAAKLRERLVSLARDVKLDRLLSAFNQLTLLFDESTVSGATLKELLTFFGNTMVSAFVKVTPLARKFFQGMIIAGLQLSNTLLRSYIWFKKTFGTSVLKDVDALSLALDAGKFTLYAIVGALGVVAAAGAAIAAPFLALQAIFVTLPRYGEELGEKLRAFFLNADWSALGGAVIDGLIGGLRGGFVRVVDTVKELGSKIKGAFTGKMEIRSPSKVSHRWGVNIGEGLEGGIDEKTPDVAKSLDAMAPPPKARAGAAAGGGGLTINLGGITFQLGGAPNAESVKAALSDPSILEQLIALLETAALSSGIPAR